MQSSLSHQNYILKFDKITVKLIWKKKIQMIILLSGVLQYIFQILQDMNLIFFINDLFCLFIVIDVTLYLKKLSLWSGNMTFEISAPGNSIMIAL